MQLSCRNKVVSLQKINKTVSRNRHIAIMVLSVFVLLVAPFIPHHHHSGVACAVIERCEQDETYNDEHTNHAGDVEKTSCVEDATYLASQSNPFGDFNNAHLFPILISTLNIFLSGNDDVEIRLPYGEFLIFYKSLEISGSNGLRAPPCIFA